MAYGQSSATSSGAPAGTFSLRGRAGNRIMPNWWNSISVRGPSRRGRGIFFRHIGPYVEAVPDALLFAARDCEGALQGFAVGDYTALRNRFLPVRLPLPGKPARHGGRPLTPSPQKASGAGIRS